MLQDTSYYNKTDLQFSFEDCKNDLDLVFGLVNDDSGNMEICFNHLQNNAGIHSWKDTRSLKKADTDTTPHPVSSQTMSKYYRNYGRIIEKSEIYDREDTKSQFRADNYDFKPNRIYVFDISVLNEHEQNFVVGLIVRKLFDKAKSDNEKSENAPERYIIFMDEMNKFAPAGMSTPIIDQLVDISERGRQLGLVLFGAEQFRSKINERILGNCAANVYGRTNIAELYSKDYMHLSEDDKNALTTLSQGQLLFTHAFLRCPVKLEFEKYDKRDPDTKNEKQPKK